ncbi:MAG: hypothetical protein P4L69_15185 [Desulfosporosinus sp.]|nr:hypothetical protein [Desulfosporosinus sp.]
MLILIYIILLILGAKATWKLVLKYTPTYFDSIGLAIAIFVILFLIIGPIMGIITSGKYFIMYFSSRTPKTKERTIK